MRGDNTSCSFVAPGTVPKSESLSFLEVLQQARSASSVTNPQIRDNPNAPKIGLDFGVHFNWIRYKEGEEVEATFVVT